MYDFDTLYPRVGMGSAKWNSAAAAGCPPDAVPLSVADMELRSAPEIVEAVKEAAEFGLWGYSFGDEAFRQSVCGWFKRRHGWDARTDWIINTPGVVPAIYTAVHAFTSPGDRVLIQPPVYHPFAGAIRSNGRVALQNPLRQNAHGGYEMDFDDLRRKAPLAKMMILCSPHNPVGRVWTREELTQVAEICYENKVLLFVDEIHCDIILPPARFVPFGTLDAKYQSSCLIGTAASKTFSLAGLATSTMFIPDEDLRAAFKEAMKADGSEFNSTFGVVATKAAYDKAEPWLDEFLLYLQGNISYLSGFLQQHLPEAKMAKLEGTYLAWVDLSCLGMNDVALTRFLQQEACLYVNSGPMFGAGGAGHIRINLACPRYVLEAALARFASALEER